LGPFAGLRAEQPEVRGIWGEPVADSASSAGKSPPGCLGEAKKKAKRRSPPGLIILVPSAQVPESHKRRRGAKKY